MSKQLEWRSNYIRDGFTQAGYIAEVENLHGECRFNYRPMLPEESLKMDIFRGQFFNDGTKIVNEIATLLQPRIESWSESVDGEPLKITVVNLRRIRPQLLHKLYDVVSGNRASDTDPSRSEEDVPPMSSIGDKMGES